MMVYITNKLNKENNRIEEMEFCSNIFLLARDFYFQIKNQDKVIRVQTDNDCFYLEYQKNQIIDLYWVDDFWNYDVSDERIDLDILYRSNMFVVEKINEYSKAICDIIIRNFPEKKIFSFDSNTSLFWNEADVCYVNNWGDIYERFPESLNQNIMKISSDLAPCSSNPWKKEYSALALMCSLFWMCNVERYGNKNEDIAILLFRYPLRTSGMVDLIKFPLYAIKMSEKKQYMGRDIIPYIDFTLDDDENCLVEMAGENAWTKYFLQVSPLTRDEVYESKNVIIIDHKLNWYNLYIMEIRDYGSIFNTINTYFRLNSYTYEKVNELLLDFPTEKKVLGIKARGTDFLKCWKNGNHIKPASPRKLRIEVEKIVNERKYDMIFLATEDSDYYEEFSNSDLKKSLITIEHYRTSGSNNTKPIMRCISDDTDDVYIQNCIYLGEIMILSKCAALIANTDCGSVVLAKEINGGKYSEFAIVAGDD